MISFDNPDELRELLTALLETSNAGMVIIKGDGTVTANRAFYKMLGYRAGEANADDWKSLLVNDSLNDLKESSVRHEQKFVKKDGSILWADINTNLHRDESGNPLFYVATVVDISERRRNEEYYRHSKQLLDYILKHNYSGVCVLDKNLKFTFASEKFIEDFRLTAHNLYGRHMYDAFGTLHNKWKDIHRESLDGHVMRGDLDIFERPDGSKEIMRWESRPWYDYNNEIGGIVIYTEFVTEFVKIKDALTEAESRYKQLAYDSRTIGWEIDPKGMYTYISDNSEAVIGYKPEEIVGRVYIYELAPQSDMEQIRIFAERAISEKISIDNFENSIVTKSGRVIHVASNGYPLIDEHGVTIGYRGSDTDISSKKRMEMFRDVMYNITKSSFSTNSIEEYLSGVREELSKVIDTRNFFVALYNKERDTLRKVVYIDEKDYFDEWKADESLSGLVIKAGIPKIYLKKDSVEYAQKTGYEFGTPAECWLGVPLIVEDERLGVIVVQSYTDPNAYDEASIKLLEMVAHELGLVLQKMSMIEKLIQAKVKAEESDRLKSAFLANMSHEIRTPLNGIMGFVQLLTNEDCTDDERNMYLDLAMESAERLLQTINNIIEISKIESGLLPIKSEIVDINELLQYLKNFFHLRAQKKGLNLRIKSSVKSNNLNFRTDKYILEGVLTNLINNAIKYTDAGFVEVGCCIVDDKTLQFSVKDTGQGIENERKHVIFDRFVQADLEHIRGIEGSGLGLSIVKGYVERLKGKIWFESELGKGSTFFFTIQEQ